jgi:DNA-binding NtrC family response regulator
VTNRITVLIIDDETTTSLQQLYQRNGFDVVAKLTPEAGETYLRANVGFIDVVILDLWMNHKGQGQLDKAAGLTLLKKIKSQADPFIEVIIRTGHEPDWHAECIAEGACAYVSKGVPGNSEALDKAVANAAVTSISARLDHPENAPESVDLVTYITNLQARLAKAKEFGAKVGA